MIAFYDTTTGKIVGGCWADSPELLATVTHIPSGCDATYIDDNEYPDVWTNMVEYTIQRDTDGNLVPVYTPIPDEVKLQSAKTAKKAQLLQRFGQILAQGFASSADGTNRVYGFTETDQKHWDWLRGMVVAGTCPNPVMVKDASGNRVYLTPEQAGQLCSDAQNFYLTNYLHWDTKEQAVEQAQTVDEVNAITW